MFSPCSAKIRASDKDLPVPEELLFTFYHNEKKGKKSFDFTDRKSIVLNLMNILTILQIIDPLTYTLWLELSNFVQKLC